MNKLEITGTILIILFLAIVSFSIFSPQDLQSPLQTKAAKISTGSYTTGYATAQAGGNDYNSQNTNTEQPATGQNTQSGKTEAIQVSFANGNYYPSTINVKKGDKVRLEVDTNSVTGCMRSILIPKFGVKKTVSSSDNVIEFTASEAGTFGFSCSMGMGRGKLVVQDENGNVPATQDVPAPASSCGGSGGCGCGGGRA